MDSNETPKLSLDVVGLDVDDLLVKLRYRIDKCRDAGGGLYYNDAIMAIEAFTVLDGWLSAGGALPKDWERTKRV